MPTHASPLRLPRWSLCLLLAACNSQGGAPSPDGLPDLAAGPARDASDPGGPADMARPSLVRYVRQIPDSTNVDMIRGLAVDPSGNLYLGCMFSATVDFGDGPRVTHGNHDVAVVKLNPAGELLWVRHFGSSEADTVLRVVSDHSGNVVVTGNFSTTLDFGAGPVNTHGKQDLYLVKYAPDGRLVFGKAIGSTEFEAAWAGLAVDASDNVYLGGGYGIVVGGSAPIDLGGGPLVSNGGADAFLVKYDPSGGHVFSKRFGGKYYDTLNDVVVAADGDVVIGGQLMGTVDLGGGPAVPPAEANNWGYVVRLSPSGAYKWAANYLTDGAGVYQLAIDASGRIDVAGTFVRSLQTRTSSLSSGNLGTHSFLLQLDSSGKETWARALAPTSESDFPELMHTDGETVYIGGEFRGTADFGFGMRTAAENGGYLVHYSATGAPLAMRQYGGASFTSVHGVAHTADALYIGGYFEKSVQFEDTTLTAKGQADGFLIKLAASVLPPSLAAHRR